MRARSWFVLGLVVVAGGAGCTPMDDALVAIFGRSMRDQPSIDTYEQPMSPAEGSIPFAAGNFPRAPGTVNIGQPEGGVVPPPVTAVQLLQEDPAVVDVENPVPADEASLARGEEVFNRACVPCHGSTGLGDGLVTEAGVPSYSLLEPTALELSDGYIYALIRIGRGAMPAYGHQITHFDRWHVVNYVRQLQGNPSPDPNDSPADAQDEDR